MATHTIPFHRVLRTKPEQVYRAFLNAGAMAKWLPPNGFTGTVHYLEARVGGSFKSIVQEGVPSVIPAEACYTDAHQELKKSCG